MRNKKLFALVGIIILIFTYIPTNVKVENEHEKKQIDDINKNTKLKLAATWTVDDDGPADFSTIQEAINAANPGDIIIVYPGTYIENVNVTKSLIINSRDGAETTIVKPPNQDNNVFEIVANYVTITGFTIEGVSGHSGTAQTWITPRYVVGGQAGIYLNRGNYTNIYNNVFLNSDIGILSGFSSNNTIQNNNILGEGIFQGFGIFLIYSKNNTIQDNNITSFWYGIWLDRVSDSNIQENKMEATWPGIRLSSSSFNTIEGNAFDFIDLTGSSSNIITKNIIKNADYGIRLSYSSNSNVIYCNNFINNVENVNSFESTNIWHSPEFITYTFDDAQYTGYLGNHWSDYEGIDADGDGVGDTPYIIPDDKNDTYPLMENFENYKIISINNNPPQNPVLLPILPDPSDTGVSDLDWNEDIEVDT